GALQSSIETQNTVGGAGAANRLHRGYRNTIWGQGALGFGRTGSYNALFGTFAGEVQDGVDGTALFGFGAGRASVNSQRIAGFGGAALQLITTWVDTILITNGGTGYTNATITIAAADTATPGVPAQNATAT